MFLFYTKAHDAKSAMINTGFDSNSICSFCTMAFKCFIDIPQKLYLSLNTNYKRVFLSAKGD
jgi:hypothetical protein